jgi:hypothetical protein
MSPMHQIKIKVVLDSELDSKSDYVILNWVRSPPWNAHFLDSPAPS